MRSRTLVNVGLLVLAIVLAIVIAFAPDEDAALDLEPLTAENPRAVSRIRLETRDADPIVLRRAEGVWDLVEPIPIAANDLRVNSLLGVLQAPVHLRIDTGGQSLERYGLVPPRARLLLDSKEIRFGDTEPINGRRYLLHDGRVALVDDAFFSHLSSSAANYVLPALLGRNPAPRSVRLPGFRLYLEAGTWRLEPPVEKAGEGDVARLADAWRDAQATAVRPYEPTLGWDDEVIVEVGEGELRFDVARTEYEVILGRRDLGIQYHLTKGTGAELLDVAPAD